MDVEINYTSLVSVLTYSHDTLSWYEKLETRGGAKEPFAHIKLRVFLWLISQCNHLLSDEKIIKSPF